MRPMLAALVVVALSLPAFSQEPPDELAFDFSSADETLDGGVQLSHLEKRLLARIKQLEKRVTQLEARDAADRGTVPYGGGQRRRGTTYGEVVPRFRDRVQPRPAPAPKRENVPDSWQRFEFNGQTFYIVPADKLRPTMGEPANLPAAPTFGSGSAGRRGDSHGNPALRGEDVPPEVELRTPRDVEEDAAPRRAEEEGDERNDSLGDLIGDLIEDVLDE